MLKRIKTYQDLPFEEGKTYATKLSTGEKFTLKRIIWRVYGIGENQTRKMLSFEGTWENHPKAGVCPLAIERLIPDRVESGEIEVCEHCGKP